MDRLLARRRENEIPPAPTNDHELTQMNGGGQAGFLAETSSIQDLISQLNRNVQNIATLNVRSLNTTEQEEITNQIHSLTEETKTLSNDIRDRIRRLGEENMRGLTPGEVQMRRERLSFVRTKFLDALQEYQRVEQDYRTKSRGRVERQYRIVNPDATPEEVRAFVDSGDTQVFAQALNSNTSRYHGAQTAYREVQARHEDLKTLERTLGELVQLFNDMSIIVEQQNDIFENLEKTTGDVELNTRVGADLTEKARDSAASARRKRWICFGIFVFVVVVLALVLGLKFGLDHNSSNNNGSSGGNSTS